jgi:hypothetical protein
MKNQAYISFALLALDYNLETSQCSGLGIKETILWCLKADPTNPLYVILKLHYIKDQPVKLAHKMTKDCLIY